MKDTRAAGALVCSEPASADAMGKLGYSSETGTTKFVPTRNAGQAIRSGSRLLYVGSRYCHLSSLRSAQGEDDQVGAGLQGNGLGDCVGELCP
ncbi:MAG: hypothetical protein QOH48_346 [Actinomycetota bacterium]|nr:hypothetical protein [Actinomycetota bacterium]